MAIISPAIRSNAYWVGMTLQRVFLTLGWTVLCSAFLTVQARQAQQVEIESAWVGLGRPSTAAFLIIRSSRGYWCGNKPVEAKLVNDLVSALNGVAMPEPSLQNLGLTREWLEEAVRSDPVKSRWKDEEEEQGKEEAFRVAFTDPEFVERVLPTLFGMEQTDDYPSVKVVVICDDGSALSASSQSYHVFMLPWRLGNASTVKTFNANISRAVAALMEKDATNWERLQGAGLGVDLADAVWMGITSRHQ